jgi:hypothetical protein
MTLFSTGPSSAKGEQGMNAHQITIRDFAFMLQGRDGKAAE